VKPVSIVSEKTAKNKRWMQEKDSCGKVIYFELTGKNCMKIITQDKFLFWIMDYQGFLNNQVNLYEFSPLELNSN
jgi:hypothetical protein